MDIRLQRADGSTYTPKIVAFHCWVTNRLFAYPIFLRKGEGVRQAHVIEAIIAFVMAWGLPEVFYIDNGSEFGAVELIADALKLNTLVRYLGDDDNMCAALKARRSAIVKSQPYNAPAKPVEGLFGVLERGVLSMVAGWVGGNRMEKKTANVGQEPPCYPGTEDDFRKTLALMLEAYETHPQQGALKGRSPREVYAAAIEAGWKRMDADPDALRAAFARPVTRQVRQGAVSLNGVTYTHEKIQKLPADTRITLRVPLHDDKSRIPAFLDGKALCIATPDRRYAALDPEGAREAARRRQVARAGIEELRRETYPVDLEGRIKSVVDLEPPAPVPESAGTIRLSDELEDIARMLKQSPAEHEALEDIAAEQRRETWRRATDEVLETLKLRANG